MWLCDRAVRRRHEHHRGGIDGVAGLSIEDSTGNPAAPLFDFDLSVARVAAARKAIDDAGTGVVLTGRSEGFIAGRPDLSETIQAATEIAELGTFRGLSRAVPSAEFNGRFQSDAGERPSSR
jgi:hypothetical protein